MRREDHREQCEHQRIFRETGDGGFGFQLRDEIGGGVAIIGKEGVEESPCALAGEWQDFKRDVLHRLPAFAGAEQERIVADRARSEAETVAVRPKRRSQHCDGGFDLPAVV